MKLPEWLVKAGARLEGSELYFADRKVDEQGLGELLTKGEIPMIYQVRSCSFGEDGEINDSSFECGLDLVASKELVWINGAYFDTFNEAFQHFTDNEVRNKRHADFYISEDHYNLCRYGDAYNEAGEYTGQVLISEPSTIKLLEE